MTTHTNGVLRPWRRIYVISGAILSVLGVLMAVWTTARFVSDMATGRVVQQANAPMELRAARQDSVLRLVAWRQGLTQRQISTLARAIGEPNAIRRGMLLDHITEIEQETQP